MALSTNYKILDSLASMAPHTQIHPDLIKLWEEIFKNVNCNVVTNHEKLEAI